MRAGRDAMNEIRITLHEGAAPIVERDGDSPELNARLVRILAADLARKATTL